jgi:sulfur carrier protein ThiS
MALPRGATVVDFAYAIHSNVGDRTTAAKINNEQVPLRTELKNGDVVEIITEPVSTPNPAWLGFVRTGRARSKIRHYLKTLAQTESEGLGEKLLTQAIRAEGLEQLPPLDAETQPMWEKLLRFTGNRTRSELMTDLGLGKRIASIVAKRLMVLMSEHGHRPDALLMTRERYTSHETLSQGAVTLGAVRHLLQARARRQHRRLSRPGRRTGRPQRALHGGQAPAAQGQRTLHRGGLVRRAHPHVRNRGGGHRHQWQGCPRPRGRGAGEFRSGYHPCRHG